MYRKSDGEGTLFDSEELAAEAEESGEWFDTPAKCGGNHSSTGKGIGYIVPEELIGKDSDELSAAFTKDELKLVAKELGVKVHSKHNEKTIAQNIIDAIGLIPKKQEDNEE